MSNYLGTHGLSKGLHAMMLRARYPFVSQEFESARKRGLRTESSRVIGNYKRITEKRVREKKKRPSPLTGKERERGN